MARDYFKVVNLETGEEKLTIIPPAVQVISRRNLKDVLNGDVRIGFYAAIYGALHREAMDAVAKGDLKPEAFADQLTEWLWVWEPDVATIYDADGNPQPQTDDDAAEEDADPLP